MNLLSKISLAKISLALSLLLIISSCNTKLKNTKTESIKIYGNCSKCEANIENAGYLQQVSQVDWNKDTKIATITYDTTQTNQTEILKRIALAGYDSDQFLAPDDVFGNLLECCKYERVKKTALIKNEKVESHSMENQSTNSEAKQEVNQLKGVFDNYFSLKDAFVKSDTKLVASLGKNLVSKINEVKMEKLSTEEHYVWMKVMGDLKANTDKVSTATDIEEQRNAFMDISENIYDLMKVSKQDASIYLQNCPMYNDGKGANWLSKENEIKNPYYGTQMLKCGKTIETIKK